MLKLKSMDRGIRTWIELDKKALFHNLETFLGLIGAKAKFMAVIKSNAYGHGLVATAKTFMGDKEFQKLGWFGVDSIVEGMRLRKEGISIPIHILGMTLPSRIIDAARNNISITISNFEALDYFFKSLQKPKFHLKVDTGMHRQGFLFEDISRLILALKKRKLAPQGIYTHFSAAKDPSCPAYTLGQLKLFLAIDKKFKQAGFGNYIRHASATGGTLLMPKAHLDMVRVGIGLYGYWPSDELKIKNENKKIDLKPVLQWKTIVGEIKKIPSGSFVGYDLTERVSRLTTIAVLPIGYWHGFDRGLSGIGEVLVGGRRRKVLGRVSMDMVVVDITEKPKVRVGDEVVLIGGQGREFIWADEIALKIDTSQYEFLTRLNPLMKRV